MPPAKCENCHLNCTPEQMVDCDEEEPNSADAAALLAAGLDPDSFQIVTDTSLVREGEKDASQQPPAAGTVVYKGQFKPKRR